VKGQGLPATTHKLNKWLLRHRDIWAPDLGKQEDGQNLRQQRHQPSDNLPMVKEKPANGMSFKE